MKTLAETSKIERELRTTEILRTIGGYTLRDYKRCEEYDKTAKLIKLAEFAQDNHI